MLNLFYILMEFYILNKKLYRWNKLVNHSYYSCFNNQSLEETYLKYEYIILTSTPSCQPRTQLSTSRLEFFLWIILSHFAVDRNVWITSSFCFLVKVLVSFKFILFVRSLGDDNRYPFRPQCVSNLKFTWSTAAAVESISWGPFNRV